jgi:hypothetical protein
MAIFEDAKVTIDENKHHEQYQQRFNRIPSVMAQNHTQACLQSALFVRARIDTKTTLFEDRMPRGVENCPAKSR